MGLCASQARLLMLTARKSDLEYRRMQISNDKLALAREQEEVAKAYSDKIGNTCFKSTIGGKETTITGANIGEALKDFAITPDEDGLNKKFGKSDYTELSGDEFNLAVTLGLVLLTDKDGNDVNLSVSDYDIDEGYYTEDDAAAEAEYKAATAKLQRKEKELDLEAEQIETQYSAVTTEIESVQNIVKKNSEATFKYFS